jgi:hypothetical protein
VDLALADVPLLQTPFAVNTAGVAVVTLIKQINKLRTDIARKVRTYLIELKTPRIIHLFLYICFDVRELNMESLNMESLNMERKESPPTLTKHIKREGGLLNSPQIIHTDLCPHLFHS